MQALGRAGLEFKVTLRNQRVHPDKRRRGMQTVSPAEKKSKCAFTKSGLPESDA